MANCEIRIAYSRGKHGFTAYSHESTLSPWHGRQRSGWHAVSAETLAEARAILTERICGDWHAVGLPVPPFVDCGRVSHARGINGTF